MIRQHLTDHVPAHVHVFLDDALIARVAIPSGDFLTLNAQRHRGRILAALRRLGLIG